jgi:hypothetical protein
LNKVIPLFMLREFIRFNVFFALGILIFNWVISFSHMLKSWQLIQLIGWSSITRKGYFLLLARIDFSNVVLVSLGVYRVFLYFIFRRMKESYYFKGNFFIIVMLFGVPPLSIFLFKVSFFVVMMEFFSVFWVYLFSMIFFFLGIGYFSFFVKERFNLYMKVNYTSFFPSERKIWWVIFSVFVLGRIWVMFFWC